VGLAVGIIAVLVAQYRSVPAAATRAVADVRGAFDELWREGGRMMSIGIHPRVSGNPSRSDGLAHFIDYAQRFSDVAFMRRIDIARQFAEQHPASKALEL